MARHMTPAQFRSHLQQQANRRRQAINRYNQAVQDHNRKVKATVDNYNRQVRAYNQRLRANQQRVQQAIRQLQSRPVLASRYVTFRTSVETLLRSYVADGVSDDFCRIAASAVDGRSRALLLEVLDDAEHANLAVGELEAAGAQDEVLVSRLALWGRRLMGEALTQAQRVAADRDSLSALLTGGVDRPGKSGGPV